jgi:putative selenate reductase
MRCMGCDKVCLNCVDVCPNRANETVWLDGRPQIVHIDGRCNECGNCGTFCPYESLPYRDKLTYFASEADFRQSENPGWTMLDGGRALVRLDGGETTADLSDPELPKDAAALMRATLAQMPWLARA